MRSRTATWLCGLGAIVLIGIPVLAMAEAWDKNLPSSGRFQVLPTFQHQAVLDKNTGLVWERAPDSPDLFWADAAFYCVRKNVGGAVGWRLPSVVELRSVQDLSLPAPFVPTNIFNVQATGHWSATVSVADPALAWVVGFFDAGVALDSGSQYRAWCVRGGMNADAYGAPYSKP